jgi:hypothetical protein
MMGSWEKLTESTAVKSTYISIDLYAEKNARTHDRTLKLSMTSGKVKLVITPRPIFSLP